MQMLEWSKTYVSNIAGEIAFLIALIMWATSFPRVRRKMFEVFFYTHQMYILYIFFYVLHVGTAYFCMILPGILLFIIDRHLRFLQSRKQARLVSARILPSEAVELCFSKSPGEPIHSLSPYTNVASLQICLISSTDFGFAGLTYKPTSILFVNVPTISKLQWHPFTVTSNCKSEPDVLSIVIKTEGSWTQKLYNKLSSPSGVDCLDVYVEGPYGPTSSHFLRSV